MNLLLVPAIIMLCPASAPTQCEQHPMKVERKVCGLHTQAQRGEQMGTVYIKCTGGKRTEWKSESRG